MILWLGVVCSIGFPLPGQETSPSPGEVVIEKRTLEAFGEEVQFEIGTLYVPENRSETETRTIGVGFARFRALEPSSTPPIFLLPGGPGFSYLNRLEAGARGREGFLRMLGDYRKVTDVVIVDQRGCSPRGDTLVAGHRFEAPPLDRPRSLEWRVQQFEQFARAVVEQYADSDIDLAGYTVKECAGDVHALRAALGYERITLVGTSFGSQWSFAVMRLHPEIVARALLSGVEPLDHGYDMPSYVFAAFQRMWRTLEDDERYAPHLPPGGVTEAARVVRERLERQPVRLQVKKGWLGSPQTAVLGPEDFSVWDPAQIVEIYHGQYDGWQESALGDRRGGFNPQIRILGPLIDSSLGVTPQRRDQLWGDPATRFIGRENFALYLASAPIWPSPDVGDDFRRPVLCPIPVVFAQGDWDTSTPLENTFEIAPYFPESRVLIAERGGHGVLGPIARQRPQVWAELEEFLRTGDLEGIPPRIRLAPSRRFEAPDLSRRRF